MNQEIKNIEIIKEQINLKNQDFPYYGTIETVKNVITDRDHFPYSRFWRKDHFVEREAGWRYRKTPKTEKFVKPELSFLNFNSPCSYSV